VLSYEEILRIHDATLREHGGPAGVLNESNIISALNQPLQTFGGVDLYVGPIAKSAALGFFLSKAHGFTDGNKRVAYIAMKIALFLNGFHLQCSADEGEAMILGVVEGKADLATLTRWVEDHIKATEEYEDVDLSFAEVTPISAKAWEIEAARPPYWKTRMLSQVLSDEITKHSRVRDEHRQGSSSGAKLAVPRNSFFDWVGEEMHKRGPIISSQGQIINLLGDIAFSQSETGGNLDHMVSLARELGGIYRDNIDWSQKFRRVDMPPHCQPLLESIATYLNDFIEQVESLPDILLNELEKAEQWEGDGPYVMQICLEFAPQDSESMGRELQALAQRLGLENEDGDNPATHISAALSSGMHITHTVIRMMRGYSAKVYGWRRVIAQLESRPLSVAKPQRDAILKSWIQLNKSTVRDFGQQTLLFEEQVEKISFNCDLLQKIYELLVPEAQVDHSNTLAELAEVVALYDEVICELPFIHAILDEEMDGESNNHSDLLQFKAILDRWSFLANRFKLTCQTVKSILEQPYPQKDGKQR
jgi:death-on-curing protein